MTAGTSTSLQLPVVEPIERGRTSRAYSPITFRGAIISGFGVYLLIGPVARETDIVAAVFAATILFLVLALLLLTLVSGLRIRRTFSAALSFPEGDEESIGESGIYAGKEVGCLLKVSPVSLWPLYVLSMRLEFETPGIAAPLHKITGSFEQDSLLPLPLTLPHRGRWRLRAIDYRFGDQFGLTQLRWRSAVDPGAGTLTVRPPRPVLEALPIITSCQRSGDLATDLHERRGDLFDLKPYHPADGMRRIVWKIFARRGELISRQPEASMTPEGQVLIHTVSTASEDGVCGATLRYLEELESIGIEIFLGCEGMQTNRPARSIVEAERLMIDSVWRANRSTPSDLEREVTGLLGAAHEAVGPTTSIDRVLLFCSAQRLELSEHSAALIALGRRLEAQRVKPIFLIDDSSERRDGDTTQPTRFSRLFIAAASPERHERGERKTYENFLGAATNAGWDVIRFGANR